MRNHDWRTVLDEAARGAAAFLHDLATRRVGFSAGAKELREALGGPLSEGPTDPREVVALLAQAGDRGLVATPSGRYFGFVIGGSVPASMGVARERGAWVHVDGAIGLWAAASPRLKPHFEGLERADSWATDAHKWLNVPYDSGIAITAHPDAHREAMGLQANYLARSEGERDPADWSPALSRRAFGSSTTWS